MASSNSLLSEEQLQCSICLEIFTKPVSTPCGHNYCMACLNKCWDNNQQYRCPFCKKQFSKRPELCVNTFISNLVAQFKESVKVQSSTRIKKPHAAQGNVPCDVCTDPAQKSCLDCGMSLCAKHLEPHKTAAKLKPHRIIDAVKNLEDFICQKHQKPLELFCRNDQTCVCLFCTEGEHKSHKTVRLEEECTERKTKVKKTWADVQQMIHDRLQKIEEIKQSVVLKRKSRDKEHEDSTKIFRDLMSSIESMQSNLLMMLEEKQKDIERQAAEFIKSLEQEIAVLKRSGTELEKLLQSEDHLHLLKASLSLPIPTFNDNWNKIEMNSRFNVEDVMRDVRRLQQSVNSATKQVSAHVSLDDQKQVIAGLLETEFQKGDTWYLVDIGWFKKWKSYVGFDKWNMHSMGDEIFYPGPVDNSELLTDSLSLKENLIDELDYISLPKEAWGKMISWYGLTDHQKPIARKVVERGMYVKHCMLEVYLTKLFLCEFNNMDQQVSRLFSKADTVACIENEMRKIFNIPDKKKTRLWIKYMSNTFECLACPGTNVQDAGLFQEQLVLIEQRNEDGTWPQAGVTNPRQQSQKRNT